MSSADIILPLHLITLLFTMWTLFQADHLGLEWVRGKEAVLSGEELRTLHKRMWIGLSLMITTGFLMFWPMREFLLARPQFYVKMSLVLALIVNGFAIGHLQKIAIVRPYRTLSAKEKTPLFISGVVSTISWVGAATMAFFLIPD